MGKHSKKMSKQARQQSAKENKKKLREEEHRLERLTKKMFERSTSLNLISTLVKLKLY